MDKLNIILDVVSVILVLCLIGIIIGWEIYQWNTCMDKIGDFGYCLQHTFG